METLVNTDSRETQVRARLAGALFLGINALYIASLIASEAGPDAIRRPAVALQTIACAGTIALAWSLYELLKPAGPGLALLAFVFRVAEAAIFGVLTVFSLLLLGEGGSSGPGSAGLALVKSARDATGQVGQVYFCAGSAIFFFLFMRSRFIPRAIAVFGFAATIVWLASALVEIGAPAVARYLAFSGPVFLLAETATGLWLLVAGAKVRETSPAVRGPSATRL